MQLNVQRRYICAPGATSSYVISRPCVVNFQIVAFDENISEDVENFCASDQAIRKSWSERNLGLPPLPTCYVVPVAGDLALIRITEWKSKDPFALPSRLDLVQKDQAMALVVRNSPVSLEDLDHRHPELTKDADRIYEGILNTGKVCYHLASMSRLRLEDDIASSHVGLRFNISKGATGSDLFCEADNGQPRLLGVLQEGLQDKAEASAGRILLCTWKQPLIRAFILREIVPRFRRNSTAWQRIRYKRSNLIAEAWQEVTR